MENYSDSYEKKLWNIGVFCKVKAVEFDSVVI